jgi:hypothetical protein
MKPVAKLCPRFYLGHRLAVLNTQPYNRQPRQWTPADMVSPDPDHPQTYDLTQPKDLMPDQAIMPTIDAGSESRRLTKRWVYVFQERGTVWSWFAEYWVDKESMHE